MNSLQVGNDGIMRLHHALQQTRAGDIGGLVETSSDGPTKRVPALVRKHCEGCSAARMVPPLW